MARFGDSSSIPDSVAYLGFKSDWQTTQVRYTMLHTQNTNVYKYVLKIKMKWDDIYVTYPMKHYNIS
jgi:hypothetical protein